MLPLALHQGLLCASPRSLSSAILPLALPQGLLCASTQAGRLRGPTNFTQVLRYITSGTPSGGSLCISSAGPKCRMVMENIIIQGWKVYLAKEYVILGDRWLPSQPSFIHVCQFPSDRDRLQIVEDLIVQETKEWDAELIHQIFSPTGVAAILKIPLSHSGQKDRIVWHWHPKGEFYVKSVYECLMQKRSQEEAGSSHAGPLINLKWKNTWKLPIKGKIKNFLWRCWFGFLSKGVKLKQKKLDCDVWCPWDCLDVHKASFQSWWFEVCFNSNSPGLTPETVIARKAQEEWLESSDIRKTIVVERSGNQRQDNGGQKSEVDDSQCGVGHAHLAVSALSNTSCWLGLGGRVLTEGVLILQWSEAKQFTGTKEEGKLLTIRWILEKAKGADIDDLICYVDDRKIASKLKNQNTFISYVDIVVADIYALLNRMKVL
ncbi:ribonuclease H-like superfamily protein [Striga asiatica]|uniref:Ribonuclease H-like superfamily protein n=1 Tax=Striga asiatica TaxID=4170 RepID=A0A5A7R188_STRAF|nr:ribonuclease H-like superfamily protein [Striga asiatica]